MGSPIGAKKTALSSCVSQMTSIYVDFFVFLSPAYFHTGIHCHFTSVIRYHAVNWSIFPFTRLLFPIQFSTTANLVVIQFHTEPSYGCLSYQLNLIYEKYVHDTTVFCRCFCLSRSLRTVIALILNRKKRNQAPEIKSQKDVSGTPFYAWQISLGETTFRRSRYSMK